MKLLFLSGENDLITYMETPPIIDVLDKRSRDACNELRYLIESLCTGKELGSGTDLFTLLNGKQVIIIKKGIFKFYHGNRFVRLYHDRDLLFMLPEINDGCRCISEFGIEILTITIEELERHASETPRIMELFIEISSLQQRIMNVLCASQTTEEIVPDFMFRQYEPGVNIIIEGDPAQDIFMLISGEASVTVEGISVGIVHPGEIFGEISFFTSGKRSATVTAAETCLVQMMSREDFLQLVKVRPSVNLAISKTLSERLIDTNRRIAEKEC